MTTGAGGPTGGAPTGGGPTGATGTTGRATGATGRATGATGATGPKDRRLDLFKVPEKFEKEPWAKEVKSVEDLWEKMSGVQKLIGKDKVVLPGENADPEIVAEFRKKMGIPENPEGYEFKSIETLKDVERNVDLDHTMKKIFFEENVPKEAGQRIVNKYEAALYEMNKPMIEQSAQRNLDFQKLADEVLGEDKVAAMTAFKSIMRESLGEKAYLADKIETMSNEELMPLIVFSKKIHDTYIGENRIPGKPGAQPGMSGDLKTDFQALSGQKVAIKTDKNMPEHIKRMKLSNINAQMTKIGAKADELGIDLFK